MKDDLLIRRIRAGDADAAEELVRSYYPQIQRFCRWQCGDSNLAEDLTQEAFLKAFRSLDQYRKHGHFKAWLYSVAKSVCIDELRRERGEYLIDYDVCEFGEDYAGIKQVEDADEIRRLLSELPDEQKEALILRYMDGFSYREIGDILGIPYRTAQSRVNLAVRAIRER